MALFPLTSSHEDNYKLLLCVLVEKLGGNATVTDREVHSMANSHKTLYIEMSALDDSVTLEVVPNASPR